MPFLAQIHQSKTLKLLELLIARRLLPQTDTQALDQEIWDKFGRRFCVVFTDLSGFSRMVAEYGIIHFLQNIFESQRIFEPCIDAHQGQVIKSEGDSLLILFPTATQGLSACIDMQKAAHLYNQDKKPEEQILPCLGLGYGDLLYFDGHEVFGAEVNAASKLGEDTARAWEILITENAALELKDHPQILSIQPISEIPPGSKGAYKVQYSL